MKRLNTFIVIVLGVMLLAAACSSPEPTETAAPDPTQAADPTATSLPPTDTPEPTSTPSPTETPSPDPTETALPTDTPEPTATQTSEPATEAAPSSYAPASYGVWELGRYAYDTFSNEACGEHYQHDFYGLVALTPQGSTLTWMRQQDSIPYALAATGPNDFSGSGASAITGFTLNIDVTFNGPGTLFVTYTLTPEDNQDCRHTYQYEGVQAW